MGDGQQEVGCPHSEKILLAIRGKWGAVFFLLGGVKVFFRDLVHLVQAWLFNFLDTGLVSWFGGFWWAPAFLAASGVVPPTASGALDSLGVLVVFGWPIA
jgi:hypothetical protein